MGVGRKGLIHGKGGTILRSFWSRSIQTGVLGGGEHNWVKGGKIKDKWKKKEALGGGSKRTIFTGAGVQEGGFHNVLEHKGPVFVRGGREGERKRHKPVILEVFVFCRRARDDNP